MASYVILGRWTGQGIQNVKKGPERLKAVKAAFKERGIRTESFHLTFGRYDFVMNVDAESDDKLASALLSAASEGNASTETLRAFDEDEYRAIVKGM
ncbi:MAG: GYD domain-containing protein [Gemmatimonadota bacterium]